MATHSTPSHDDTRIAVLIDCDNVSPAHAGAVLEELVAYGTPTIKRAYGDWTTTQLSGWKKELNRRAIQPVQQFAYTAGKNSTDSALIIDAMDLLWMGNVEAFAIVSSDSDFTRLATRLRESGKKVIGLGQRKTPVSLRACSRRRSTRRVTTADGRRSACWASTSTGRTQTSTPVSSASGSSVTSWRSSPTSTTEPRDDTCRCGSSSGREVGGRELGRTDTVRALCCRNHPVAQGPSCRSSLLLCWGPTHSPCGTTTARPDSSPASIFLYASSPFSSVNRSTSGLICPALYMSTTSWSSSIVPQ